MTRKTLTLPARTPPAAPSTPAPRAARTAPPTRSTAARKASATPKPPTARAPGRPKPASATNRAAAQRPERPERPARRTGPAAAPRKAPAAAVATGERLSKRVMALRQCSRSDAEQYITSGFVQVAGLVVDDPAHRVTDSALVTLSPEATLLAPPAVTFVLHKPPQWLDGVDADDAPRAGGRPRAAAPAQARSLLVAAKQWPQDPTQQAFLKRFTQHLDACVPLERGASGLVVFTQDWRVTRKLEEHLHDMEHEYLVDVAQAVAPAQMHDLTRLLHDPREQLPPVKASIGSQNASGTRLRFAIKGAHPGLIGYVLGKVGLPIAAMQRTRLGRVALGALPVGHWRYLAGYEKF